MNGKLTLETYFHTRVQTADRGKLLLMVYDAAIRFVREARQKIIQNDVPGKGAKIDKAYAAIAELRKSLDMEKGKDLARSLDRLYSYLLRQITLANIRNDPQALDVVLQILKDLRSAWDQVVQKERKAPQSVDREIMA